MKKKKETPGQAVGKIIDGAWNVVGGFLSDVTAKPGQAVRSLHDENVSLGNRTEVMKILSGFGSANLKRDAAARQFMEQNSISKEDVEQMRSRYR